MAAVGKHFPGHGHVAADSHLEVPVDDRPFAAIDAADLIPYRRLIPLGLDGRHARARDLSRSGLHGRPGSRRSGCSRSCAARCSSAASSSAMISAWKAPASRAASWSARRAALAAGCDLVLACNRPDAADELLAGLHWEAPAGWAARVNALRCGGPAAAVGGAVERSRLAGGARRPGASARLIWLVRAMAFITTITTTTTEHDHAAPPAFAWGVSGSRALGVALLLTLGLCRCGAGERPVVRVARARQRCRAHVLGRGCARPGLVRRLARASAPPGLRHSFGLARAEVIAAFVNGLSMLLVVVLISVEAIRRLLDPAPVAGLGGAGRGVRRPAVELGGRLHHQPQRTQPEHARSTAARDSRMCSARSWHWWPAR